MLNQNTTLIFWVLFFNQSMQYVNNILNIKVKKQRCFNPHNWNISQKPSVKRALIKKQYLSFPKNISCVTLVTLYGGTGIAVNMLVYQYHWAFCIQKSSEFFLSSHPSEYKMLLFPYSVSHSMLFAWRGIHSNINKHSNQTITILNGKQHMVETASPYNNGVGDALSDW